MSHGLAPTHQDGGRRRALGLVGHDQEGAAGGDQAQGQDEAGRGHGSGHFLLGAGLLAQHFPGNVGPELLAHDRLDRRVVGSAQLRRALDGGAVFSRKPSAARKVGSHVAAIAVAQHRREGGLAAEDVGGALKRRAFWGEFDSHTPSLRTFDYQVNLHLTPVLEAVYGGPMSTKKEPVDPIRLGIGQKLKAAREAKGLTQQEVADKFDVKKATVSAWETGAGAPDAMRLRSLARLYDVSADALLWDDSLTPEAMKFAAQFDALSEKQRRSFKVMWMAYFEDALSDEGVEAEMPITKNRRHANEINEADSMTAQPQRRRTDHK